MHFWVYFHTKIFLLVLKVFCTGVQVENEIKLEYTGWAIHA